MTAISLAAADRIADAAFAKGSELGLLPLTVAVLDPGGHLVLLKRQDGSGILRPDVAIAKAWGPLSMGWPAGEIGRRAENVPQFLAALGTLSGGKMIPVQGGVPVKDADGELIGSVGVTGDTSQNDEKAAVAGIEAAGLVPWLD